uniref:Uncharacterized protein n=1 Tax=Anguilla anguilla TaxID=7936 RepID=A0A0E9PE68_ANGAN
MPSVQKDTEAIFQYTGKQIKGACYRKKGEGRTVKIIHLANQSFE